MAVGVVNAGNSALAERWNGTQWTVVPTANPPIPSAMLFGVWCPSRNECDAVVPTKTAR